MVAIDKEDPKEFKSFLDLSREMMANYKDAMKNYESSPFQPGEEEMYKPIREANAKYIQMSEDLIARMEKGTPEDRDYVYKQLKNGEYRKLAGGIRKCLEQLIKMYTDLTVTKNVEQKAEQEKVVMWNMGISAASFLVIFAVLFMLAQKISSSISDIATHLRGSGGEVSTAVQQLSAAGQSLAQSSTEAAASLEETVAALEEMSSMVKMNAENAKQAASLSQVSKDRAETGEKEIKTLISSMHEISDASKKIEEIISVIDDIAFQTNLLALNASVEAARAGEQGKGFAVVADAVRSLAQKSAEAAKDISGLIKDSVAKISHGTDVADKSGTVLSEIVVSIKKVSDLNNEISAANSEQTTSIQQVSKAMQQLDQSSQQNAAASEQIAGTAQQISGEASKVHDLVEELGTIVSGSKAA
jgi:methyl-accepting chemotaxis protein